MEIINFKITEAGGIHIEGFPDAEKLIQINGENAQKLAALTLHQHDLQSAIRFLGEIEGVTTDAISMTHEACWFSAVVIYMKCFGSNLGRGFPLAAKDVFIGNSDALSSHDHIGTIRNKHIVHDENDMNIVGVSAVLNKVGVVPRIPKVISMQASVRTLEIGDWNNLRLLCHGALNFVNLEYENLCNNISAELEELKHQDLLSMPSLIMDQPNLNNPKNRRKKL